MESGLYFYWVGWIVWTLLTFFHIQSRTRYFIISWLLLLIMTLHMYLDIYNYRISISYFFLLMGSIYLYVLLPLKFKTLFITFTVMISYIALRIWEKMAPVWFFIPTEFMIPITISCIILLIINQFELRLISVLVGMTFGELFHSLILSGYYLNNEIVSYVFFDYLAITIFIIITIHIVRILCTNTIQSIIMFLNNRALFK